MRGAVVVAPRRVEIQDLPMPTPGPNDVVVRIRSSSICGSDVHVWAGEHPRMPIPTMMGHEPAGEVAAVGEAVQGLAVGMRVAVDGVLPCHECQWCRRGLGNVCQNYRTTGQVRDGGLAEYTPVPSRNVYPLPDQISFDVGALAQPLAISYHGIYERSQINSGDFVVVEGAGPIGLFALVLARMRGARVVSTDLVAARLAMARRLGAEEVVDVGREDVAARVLELTNGVGADLVVEAVGGNQSKTVRTACQIARRGGSITLLGAHGDDHVDFPAYMFRTKELTFAASQSYYGAYPKALALLTSGQLQLDQMISHTLPLDSLQHALELIESHDPGVVKIVIRP